MVNKIRAVVVGGSAGGFDALVQIVRLLPEQLSYPIICVLHLSPRHEFYLPDLLQRETKLTVKVAESTELIVPGTIYLAPPDLHLSVEPDESLSLSVEEPVKYARPAIDLLFNSAAMHYQKDLVGIILTGANSDGAAGLKTVAAFGGFTIVQDLDEAAHGAMPLAALNAVPDAQMMDLKSIGEFLKEVTNVST